MDISPIILSIKVATVSTLIALVLALAIARKISLLKLTSLRKILDSILIFPLVIPPTVVGYLLLVIFSPRRRFGEFLQNIGINILFNWYGAVLATVVVSFPLIYRSCLSAFDMLEKTYLEYARTEGANEVVIFFRIVLPNILPAIISGSVLAFSRAMGEFGATIMVAGNIPHKTQTISLAIYSAVQNSKDEEAWLWVITIIAISFTFIYMSNLLNDRYLKNR